MLSLQPIVPKRKVASKETLESVWHFEPKCRMLRTLCLHAIVGFPSKKRLSACWPIIIKRETVWGTIRWPTYWFLMKIKNLAAVASEVSCIFMPMNSLGDPAGSKQRHPSALLWLHKKESRGYVILRLSRSPLMSHEKGKLSSQEYSLRCSRYKLPLQTSLQSRRFEADPTSSSSDASLHVCSGCRNSSAVP